MQYTDKINLSPPVHTAYGSCLRGASVPVTFYNARAGLNLGHILKLHQVLLLGARSIEMYVCAFREIKFSPLLLEQLLLQVVAGEEV